MPARKRLVAAVNVIGPDGRLVQEGQEIPQEWLTHDEFDAEHLVASGGARKKG